ncbi:MAG: hypothetical protein NWF03_04775 [Candidatus Bathyarchaeota archaeon]|nr:hypothetical protein [Candidatus Bathyarchaeota archaeon]
MKKFSIIILSVTLVLGVLSTTAIVNAAKAGYEALNYVELTDCVVDGAWTTSDEWTDASSYQLDGDLNVVFRLKYLSAYPDYVYEYYLIEFIDDTTNDAEDYIQICYEAAADVGGTIPGGSTPQTDCKRWDYVGHDVSGFAYYVGDGSAWVASQGYDWEVDINIVDSFGTSPESDTPHLIVEVMIEHLTYSIGTPQWIRIAAYDASNDAAGVQSWPESSVDVPDDWGLSTAVQGSIPEGLTAGVMVVLSSASVVVGSRYLRKRSKNQKL